MEIIGGCGENPECSDKHFHLYGLAADIRVIGYSAEDMFILISSMIAKGGSEIATVKPYPITNLRRVPFVHVNLKEELNGQGATVYLLTLLLPLLPIPLKQS